MRTITVKGTGNVSARPDYIILSLNIEVLSETYDRAMSEAAERIERLQGAAVRVGYRKEDLKTTSFDVQTRYENVKDRQGNYKREFAGYACSYRLCALPGFVDSKNEEKTERNAGYLVVSQSGGGMLRQGTREGIRRTPANRGMRAHRIVKGLDISEDVCHGMCP